MSRARLTGTPLVFACMTALMISVVEARPTPSLRPKPPANSRESFLKVMKTPTILLLREFRGLCERGDSTVDFEEQAVFDKLAEVKRRPDHVKLRALIFAAGHCADAKSKESLLKFLGVDMLMANPVLLIRAIHREKTSQELLMSVANAEPNEFSGVECADADCSEKKRQVFEKKKKLIETAKVRKNEEPVRAAILRAFEKS